MLISETYDRATDEVLSDVMLVSLICRVHRHNPRNFRSEGTKFKSRTAFNVNLCVEIYTAIPADLTISALKWILWSAAKNQLPRAAGMSEVEGEVGLPTSGS